MPRKPKLQPDLFESEADWERLRAAGFTEKSSFGHLMWRTPAEPDGSTPLLSTAEALARLKAKEERS